MAMNQIEELKQAYEQGFISKEDYGAKLLLLTESQTIEDNQANNGLGELGDLAKNALKTDMAADMAAGAVGGAVIASVVPVIGTATGAVVGAAIGAFKNFMKKP